MTKKHIYIIVCSFSIDPQKIIKKITKITNKYNFEIRGVIVCNQKFDVINNNNQFWDIIEGSNKLLDFSAYFEGFTFFQHNYKNFNNCIFINDSIFIKHNYNFCLKLLLNNVNLFDQIKMPCIAGFKSYYASICIENPWSKTNFFIPTYLFMLNSGAYFLFEKMNLKYLNTEFLQSNILEYNITNQFKEHIKSHLYYDNDIVKWNGIEKYDINEYLVEKKSKCIFLEHYLSGQIYYNGSFLFLNSSRKLNFKFLLYEYIHRMTNFL